MFDDFGYLATWFPNVVLKLGDVGVLRDRVFEQITTLEERGISFNTSTKTAPADYEHTSSDSVSIRFKAAGDAPAAGSALRRRLGLL